jgi:GAF domain-containing protein
VTDLAVAAVDGAGHCGITVLDGGVPRTEAASDPVTATIEALQYETGEGPCLESLVAYRIHEVLDLWDESRWPAFVERARLESPVRSALSVRLDTGAGPIGSLNLYAQRPAAFDADDLHVASLLAAHAAVALAASNESRQLQEALETRTVIATAKGILMAREAIDEDEAFEVLRRASQRLNVKLRVVAADIVDRANDDPGAEPADPGAPARP